MSLTGCYAVMKYLVFLMNLVFWVSGLLILVLSIWMLIDPTFYISMAQDESSYYSGICLLFLAGTLLFVVGFLGCFGAYNESQRLLILFFCGLLLILVGQISAGVWAYSNSDKLSSLLRYTVRNTVQYEYGKADSQRTDSFDAIQSGLKCCGDNGPGDWAGSSWRGENSELKLTVKAPPQPFEIPKSCCNTQYTENECLLAVQVNETGLISKVIYSEGCSDKLLENLKENMNTVIVLTIGIGIVEFFALVISLILCCAIRAVTKYK